MEFGTMTQAQKVFGKALEHYFRSVQDLGIRTSRKLFPPWELKLILTGKLRGQIKEPVELRTKELRKERRPWHILPKDYIL